MPIISKVGARSFKIRAVYTAMFAILCLGAVTMIYPLMLMISGSLKSDTDFVWITPAPRYLWNDDILWMKYVESKYGKILDAERNYRKLIGSWRRVVVPQMTDRQLELAEDFRAFRQQEHWPREWYNLGHLTFANMLAKNARRFRKFCQDVYGGDIDKFSKAVGVSYGTWSQVGPPQDTFTARRFKFPETANFELFYKLKAQSPRQDWIPVNIDGDFLRNYLMPEWGTVDAYNAAHGTDFEDYQQVVLSTRPPKSGPARADWSDYVRNFLNLAYVRVDSSLEGSFQQFLRRRYSDNIATLNLLWKTSYSNFSQVPLPQGLPRNDKAEADLSAFIKDEQACPLHGLSVYGPRQAFEQFVAERRGVPVEQVAPLPMPVEQVDYLDFQEMKSDLRWEFATRNYRAVIDYLLLHGNGIINTVIFCSMMIGAQLLVNPLAAYALSRYRPPSAYKILLFCMCTMAFPPEVTMIPRFLLLKGFPLFPLMVGLCGAIGFAYGLRRLAPRWPLWLSATLGVALGVVAGYWATPLVFRQVFGRHDANISLLNTFYALVLPRMANGFMIFLLKGFFDSLPRELYEAADLDGAGEWTKFWLITMNLSKPILAVMALQAFTMAYSEFMMALVIIPDQRMWTMMIWLFQLQAVSHPTVVYASLLIAAVPTFLIFLFCQNLIMRGIVVPQEK